MRKKPAGFTLVEMLTAAAILGIVLVTLTNYLSVSSDAYDVVSDTTDEQQEARVAAQLLKYELSLAGYRGTSSSYSSSSFSANTLAVTYRSQDSDDIQVRYYEDRFYDGTTTPTLQTVKYSISDGVLMRQVGSANAEAIIAAESLNVTKYLKETGEEIPVGQGIPSDVVGFTLELGMNGTTQTLSIGLNSSQDLSH